MTYSFILLSNCLCHLLTKEGMEDLDADFYILKNNISGVGKVSKLMIGPLLCSCCMCDDVGSSFNHKAEPISSKRQVSFSLFCFHVMSLPKICFLSS